MCKIIERKDGDGQGTRQIPGDGVGGRANKPICGRFQIGAHSACKQFGSRSSRAQTWKAEKEKLVVGFGYRLSLLWPPVVASSSGVMISDPSGVASPCADGMAQALSVIQWVERGANKVGGEEYNPISPCPWVELIRV